MKKNFIVVFIFLLFTSNCLSADMIDAITGVSAIISGTSEIVSDTKAVAKESNYNYKAQIKDIVANLPPNLTKDEIYQVNRKSSAVPALANFVIGFGVGSKWQGNVSGYVSHKAVDSIAIGVGGGTALVCLLLSGFYLPAWGQSDVENPLLTISLYSLGAGVAVSLVNRTVGVFTACSYANKYNKELKKQLDLAIIPAVDGSVSFVGTFSTDDFLKLI
ncbi:MAG: P13 family porin [Sphaerochaeta sp.]